MHTTYELNTDDLSIEFIDSLKALFPHKTIEISVCESEPDETEYLLSNPANRKRLLEAIENVSKRENLVTVSIDEL
jgi:antitoxin YefM